MDDDWISYVDRDRIADLIERARRAPRGRLNLNLHPRLDDPVQRLLNAGSPGSYVRPHRHRPAIWELVLALTGHIDALVFDAGGRIIRRVPLKAGGTASSKIRAASGTASSSSNRTLSPSN